MVLIRIARRVRRDRKKELKLFIVLLIVVIIGFIIAINFFQGKHRSLLKTATAKTRTLLFSMRMKETTYRIGEPIELLLEVRNISYKPVTLKFDESLEYDFTVHKEKRYFFGTFPENVWRYSAKAGGHKKEHTVTLQPQETLEFSAVWDQTDFNGKQVPPGTYNINGVINIAGQNTELQMRGQMGGK